MGVPAAARLLRRSAARLAMGRVSGSEGMRSSRLSISGQLFTNGLREAVAQFVLDEDDDGEIGRGDGEHARQERGA